MMEVNNVLKNLTDYEGWEYAKYGLCKSESETIIDCLKKEIPMAVDVIEDSDEDDRGVPFIMEIKCCPRCLTGYRFALPKYCGNCGQRLVMQ